MGKASSAKKVARAARAGGSSSKNQRKLLFPLSIAAIVIVGIAVVVVARSGYNSASAEAPLTTDHWHAAYGFYVCDSFQPPLTDAVTDRTGIHTHGDGIIHIHPFTASYAGKNATMSAWGQTVDVQFTSNSWTLPDGTKYENGYDCNGQPAQLSVYKWNVDDPEAAPQVYTSNFGDIRLDTNRSAYTFAVVPEGTEVPKPDTIPTLDNLSDVAGSSASTQTSTVTVPVPSSDTSVPTDASSTSVPTSSQ